MSIPHTPLWHLDLQLTAMMVSRTLQLKQAWTALEVKQPVRLGYSLRQGSMPHTELAGDKTMKKIISIALLLGALATPSFAGKVEDINLCIKAVKEFTNKTVLAKDAVWEKRGLSNARKGTVRWKSNRPKRKNARRLDEVVCLANTSFGNNLVVELEVDGSQHISGGYVVNMGGIGKDASKQIKKAVREHVEQLSQQIGLLRAVEETALKNLRKPGANSNEIVKDVNSVIATWTRNN